MQTYAHAFYPPTQALSEENLQVSELHSVYVASYGNKHGIPVITLHGGPGSGTQPYFAQFFDPEKYFIIVADQRGAGRSLPKGEMRDNTTQDLITDMEKIRQHFAIDKWVVFGGSWGSTLALLYAETHPEKVLGLILRGIFLAREQDYSVFVRDGSPTALMRGKDWQKFKANTRALLQKTQLLDLDINKETIYHIYHEILNRQTIAGGYVASQSVREEAAGVLSAWEKYNSSLAPNEEDLQWSTGPDGINMAVTETTYFEKQCFIQPNQILNDIAKLSQIPVFIVQGSYDLVCPPYQADELQAALLKVAKNKNLIVRFDCIAGHTHKEAAIRSALIEAGNQLAGYLCASPRCSQ